jgi:hypothetical protein
MATESTNIPNLIHTQSRINDKWLLSNDTLKKIVNNFPVDQKIINFVDNFSTVGMDPLLYQQGFLQVVTETVFHYPATFFSEKTMKPIVNKRPFVILGAVGSLANLQSLGFKTFSNFWSEDYDTIKNPEQRINMVVEIIESICAQSIEELQILCESMSDVLNYNYEYYVNNFKKSQLTQFEQLCIQNLHSRYD